MDTTTKTLYDIKQEVVQLLTQVEPEDRTLILAELIQENQTLITLKQFNIILETTMKQYQETQQPK